MKIPINFISGGHGNFVAQLVDVAFTGKYWQSPPIVNSGTWHTHRVDYQFRAMQPQLGIPAQLWWELSPDPEQRNFYKINGWSQLVKDNNTIVTISQKTLIEKALLRANRFRVSDSSLFAFDEILNLTKDDFVLEWDIRFKKIGYAADSWQTVRTSQTRADLAARVFDSAGVACREKLIMAMSIFDVLNKESFNLLNSRLEAMNRWSKEKPENLTVVELELNWLYQDDAACIGFLDTLSDNIKVPRQISDDQICEILQYFRENIKDKPNLQEIEKVFNSAIEHEYHPINLSGPEESILINMMLIQYKSFMPSDYTFPTDTIKLAGIIDSIKL